MKKQRNTMGRSQIFLTVSLANLLMFLLPMQLAAQQGVRLPAGTTVYGELDEQVTSRKKETSIGDIIRAHVWRNVLADGRVVIEAGAPMVIRVSMVKPAKIAGRKGDVHLEAVSVRGVDGTEIFLDGGYDKSGKGRKALSWSLFALVAWPLVFIKGKHAILEPGTVFDTVSQEDTDLAIERSAAFAIRLGDSTPRIQVEILYDEIDAESKQKILPMNITICEEGLESASVVTVNEADITPIPVILGGRVKSEGCVEARGTVDLKRLANNFKKGINRFEVEVGGLRTEVLLEVEI